MPDYKENIETLANTFNIAKDDLEYLLAHEGSPGTTEMLGAPATYDYFGSLAEHEVALARLAKVTDADSFTDACMCLRECGYNDPSVVEKVKDAARVVGDRNLLDAIESIEGQEELLDTILHGYGLGGLFRMVWLMDGSAMTRIPQRALSSVAA